jgi:beta-phosphoglucomutase
LPNNGVKGIIFDMDGVLALSSPLHERAFREALKTVGVDQFHYAAVAGMRTDEALRLILAGNRIACTDEGIVSLAARKSRIARELISTENPVAPGCVPVLDSLSRHYPLALASSASKATISLFLDQNSLTGKFTCVVNGADVQRAKPAPEIYELCCRRMGLAPRECLIVEDAVTGVQAGKSAGAAVWGIPTTCAAADLRRAGADRIIRRLEDLLVLVE